MQGEGGTPGVASVIEIHPQGVNQPTVRGFESRGRSPGWIPWQAHRG